MRGGYPSLVSDFIRPQPRPRLTRNQLVAIALAAGAHDTGSIIPGGGGGGGGTNTLDVLGVGDGADGQTTDVLQIDSTNDQIEVGNGS